MSGPDLFVICKSCGSEVSPYVTECPYCGTRLRKRAPKLDRPPGRPPRRRPPRPSLGRLRPGEIPGIRLDARPYVTAALVLLAVAATVAWRAGAFAFADAAVVGVLAGDWWRPLTAPFVYVNTGYELIALTAIAVFGWLLERRHGPIAALIVFLAGGAGGMLLAAAVEPNPLASGGNGAALALLCAWAARDLLARLRGEDVEADAVGAAVVAGVLVAMPLAVDSASAVAGLGGVLAGFALGLPLARFSRAR